MTDPFEGLELPPEIENRQSSTSVPNPVPTSNEQRPVHARARNTDPDTSHQAAATITAEAIRTSQQRILAVLLSHPDGLTDPEIENEMRLRGWFTSPSGTRGRRKELVDKKLVVAAGKRKTGNRTNIVWKALP